MPPGDIADPLWVSLRVCLVALAFWLPIGLLCAWWLGRAGRFRGRWLIEALLTLPLVLPPTVIGYGLLYLSSQQHAVGRFLQNLPVPLIFSVWGAGLASALIALPLFVRTAASALASIDREVIEMAQISGATEARIARSLLFPLAYRGLFAAFALAFARALGEFGATVIIAGSIPGETETLPLALYNAIQAGNDASALRFALLLSGIGMAATLAVTLAAGRTGQMRGERP